MSARSAKYHYGPEEAGPPPKLIAQEEAIARRRRDETLAPVLAQLERAFGPKKM